MNAPGPETTLKSARRRRQKRPRSSVRELGGRKIIAEGLERNFWTDLYHNAMTVSWPVFVGGLAAAFVMLNFAFALVYALGKDPIANAREGNLADLFFFSVETTSTVGYGDMHPQTIYGHIIATSENFVAMLQLAMMTGLVFARFSRPRARIIFAKYPVVTQHNGVMTLIFRLANARSNFITEATAKLWMISGTTTEEGKRFVGFEQLRLLKSENPTFALSWTLFHPIDDDSPLQGMDKEALAASKMNFVVSIAGFDEASAQIVRTRDVFTAQDVRFGHEYVDFVWIDEHGLRHIDYTKIDATRMAPPSGSVRVAEDLSDQSREAIPEPPVKRMEAGDKSDALPQSRTGTDA